MGKVRVKTIGLEDLEQDEKKKAKARTEAKRTLRQSSEQVEAAKKQAAEEKIKDQTAPVEETTEKPEKETKKEKPVQKNVTVKQKTQSASYQKVAALVDKKKRYKLAEALSLLEQLKRTKFDETVELHFNTHEIGILGKVTLPHGTGKQTRVVIANATADAKQVEELIKTIEFGKIDFDVLIATPDTMPKLAKVARILGPRGLMPNPKNGTVTPKPDVAAKQFAGGQINLKTETKFPLLHLSVGKMSFGGEKLAENITTAVKAVKAKNIKSVTLKSTMSPGIKLETVNL